MLMVMFFLLFLLFEFVVDEVFINLVFDCVGILVLVIVFVFVIDIVSVLLDSCSVV